MENQSLKVQIELLNKVHNESIQKMEWRINEVGSSLFFKTALKQIMAEKGLQNKFISAILKGEIEQVKRLHQGGALLTEPDIDKVYPLMAAAYSTDMETLMYIEKELGKEAEVQWGMVDVTEVEKRINAQKPELRPSKASVVWLGDWYIENAKKRWITSYDRIVLQSENNPYWEEECKKWGNRGRAVRDYHVGSNYTNPCREEWRYGRQKSDFSGAISFKEKPSDTNGLGLYWPTPLTHDKAVEEKL